MRRIAPFAAALVLLPTLLADPATASVAGDLAAAQRQANKAAAQLASAETQLARAEAEVASVRSKADAARRRVAGLEGAVRATAVRRYINGPQVRIVIGDDLSRAVRANELANFVTVGAVDSVDRYRAARDDLVASQTQLQARLGQRRAALAGLRSRRAAAVAEVNRLARIQKELEAKLAREKAASAKRSGPRAASRSSATSFAASGAWMCPVQGPHAFSNDWGQPRSGGRRHEGTDILSPRNTPIVANVAGVARGHNSSLGGLSYYLAGDDGNTYFGTHLPSLGATGRVAQGTVIGYVGNSGNASGGPTHLHFEIHPGGGGPVNPYPTLAKYC